MWWRTAVDVRREWYKWRVYGRLSLGALGNSQGRVHRVGEGGESDR